MKLIVKTDDEMELFRNVWREPWNGQEFAEYDTYLQRVLFFVGDVPVGTLELKTFEPSSLINRAYPFHLYIPTNYKIIEINKIAILPQFRRKFGVLEDILNHVFDYTEDEKIDYCVAIIVKGFYPILEKKYNWHMDKIDDKLIPYKGAMVYPTIIDPRKTLEKKPSWYRRVKQNT